VARIIVKVKKSIYCHSRESRARSEALALFSYLSNSWTPAYAGVTDLGLFTKQSNLD
jgi:hypothetical protein